MKCRNALKKITACLSATGPELWSVIALLALLHSRSSFLPGTGASGSRGGMLISLVPPAAICALGSLQPFGIDADLLVAMDSRASTGEWERVRKGFRTKKGIVSSDDATMYVHCRQQKTKTHKNGMV